VAGSVVTIAVSGKIIFCMVFAGIDGTTVFIVTGIFRVGRITGKISVRIRKILFLI
jgi:hypothetical protein